ncbi:MAG: glycoside hydrolase family 30 protein [Elusimicrobia bacterium]|nr:glycoside hydrolase family 30 protein [Elusimicrobiota bacterium]
MPLLLVLGAWAAAAPDAPARPKTARVFLTAQAGGQRLAPAGSAAFTDFGQPLESQPCVFVDPSKSFQTLLGIGGALTDAAAETFAKLPRKRQGELLRAYYDAERGIGYSLARTNIHSCDFSSESYTYTADNDRELKTFSVAHDRKFRIPMIKRAIAAAGGRLTLFASPWSPPAWMKDNGSMLQGGHLLPEFLQTWADYFVRFIRAYEAEGIPVWGLTIQNEPMAKQTWESCIFTAAEERDFLKLHLGPSLAKAGLGDRKVLVWDHNRDLMYQRAQTVFGDPEAAKYAWGLAFHWYENWSGGEQQFENVRRTAEAFPGVNLFHTEGCNGPFDTKRIDAWDNAEAYGQAMIKDLNNGAVAWTDWNVLLDERGGPNHVGNFCFAPVHADTKAGSLHYTPAYYYIGHFSKFIRPGARRVASLSNRDPLLTTAFRDGDGRLAVVVMNRGEKDVAYRLWMEGKAAELQSPAHSIATLLVD